MRLLKAAHQDYVKSINGNPDTCQFPEWQFNGDLENPSFQPSLLNTLPEGTRSDGTKRPRKVCHLYVTNGVIEYCGDCTHPLSGLKVPMKEVVND